MARLLDRLSYARSIFFTAPLIILYTGIMGSLSVASSLVDPSGRIQHACARTWSRLILWTSGVQLRVSGFEHLRPNVGYVLCVNHQSHMDIPIVLSGVPFQFSFAAKKDLFSIPFLGWHLRRSGQIPIDRANPRTAVKSLREASDRIRRGTRLVIFPEGGTSFDGSIMSFKGGGFMLAAMSEADVVAVTIRGSRDVLKPKTYHVHGGTVEVICGVPISSRGSSHAELAARVREDVLTAFQNGKTLDRNSYSLSR